MSNYICRLLENNGTVRSIVPIIGSSEADAILIARHHFTAQGNQGMFELWKGKTRILTQGQGLNEEEQKTPLPSINRITHAGC
jgi:hypothetical protein